MKELLHQIEQLEYALKQPQPAELIPIMNAKYRELQDKLKEVTNNIEINIGLIKHGQ